MPDAPAVSKTTEVHLFDISDLQDPVWNPRRYSDETKMADLKAYVEGGGPIPPLMIWKGNGQAPWTVISGKRRREAYRRAGKTQIEGIILDISLQAAKILAIASNQDDKPYWLDEYAAVDALLREDPQLKQQDLARQLGWSNFWVTRAVNLTEVLNPASRQFIEQSLRQVFRSSKKSGSKKPENSAQKAPWQLSEAVAYRLTALLDNHTRDEAQSLAQKAVPVMITRQLTGPQTDELVAHAVTGQDITQFEPAAKVRKARNTSTAKPASKTPHANLSTNGDGSHYEPSTNGDKPAQSNHAYQPVVSAQGPLMPETPKPGSNMPPAWLGPIFGLGLLGGGAWLAWKAVAWIITTVVHWL